MPYFLQCTHLCFEIILLWIFIGEIERRVSSIIFFVCQSKEVNNNCAPAIVFWTQPNGRFWYAMSLLLYTQQWIHLRKERKKEPMYCLYHTCSPKTTEKTAENMCMDFLAWWRYNVVYFVHHFFLLKYQLCASFCSILVPMVATTYKHFIFNERRKESSTFSIMWSTFYSGFILHNPTRWKCRIRFSKLKLWTMFCISCCYYFFLHIIDF